MHGNYQWSRCHPFFGYRHPWRRRFLTEEEKQKLEEEYKKRTVHWLENYKDSLEREIAGINEQLEKLKKQ